MMHATLTALEFEPMLFVRYLTLISARRMGADLDRSAYTILTVLDDGRLLRVGALSKVIGMEISRLSRQTAAMLQSGLAAFAGPGLGGGMTHNLRSTSLGREHLREAPRANIGVLDGAGAHLSHQDRDAFARLLGRLNRDLEKCDHGPWPRTAALAGQN